MTGGGVHWMFQKGNVNIFDISKVQVAFINLLLQDWNGENYGEFVYHFITKNKIKGKQQWLMILKGFVNQM